jgi:hypothetical protein
MSLYRRLTEAVEPPRTFRITDASEFAKTEVGKWGRFMKQWPKDGDAFGLILLRADFGVADKSGRSMGARATIRRAFAPNPGYKNPPAPGRGWTVSHTATRDDKRFGSASGQYHGKTHATSASAEKAAVKYFAKQKAKAEKAAAAAKAIK